MSEKWKFVKRRMKSKSNLRVVFLGPPGSGKGSQAKFITDNYGLVHISTGELLRDAVRAKSALGKKVAGIMRTGDLVPDDLVIELIGDHVDHIGPDSGFILDGFPRSITQAEVLQEVLAKRKRSLSFVLHLHVDLELVVKRLSGRRTCANCGEIYNIFFKPSELPDICDLCNGELIHRADDNEESIRQRLDVYKEQTTPVLSFYENLRLLKTVDAAGSEKSIAQNVDMIFRTHLG